MIMMTMRKRMYNRRRKILSIKFKEDLSNLDREVHLFELCRRLENTTKLRTVLGAIKKDQPKHN